LLLFLVLNLPLEAFSFHAARYCLHKCCTSELFFRSGFHFNYLTIIFTICHLFGIACQTKLYIYIGWNGFFFVNFLYFVVHRGFLFFSIKLIVFIWWFLYTVCHCRDKLLARNGHIARVCWQMLVSFFFFPILIFAMETLFCNYGCCDLIENNKLETFLIYLFIWVSICWRFELIAASIWQECSFYTATCPFCSASCFRAHSCANASLNSVIRTGFAPF
jgi:hypothetical protein